MKDAQPVCAFGRPSPVDPEWVGPDHCAACHTFVNDGIAQFDAAVARGDYDADGYRPHERAALAKRRKAAA